mgnify:CR=1 FL=1
MENTDQSSGAGTPWHLWVVGVLSVLWNAIGCYDFTLTNLRDQAYLAQVPPEIIQMIDAFPVWALAAWALGVWGAMAGSLLLLLKSRYAVHAFAGSLIGLAATTIYRFGFAGDRISQDLAIFPIWAIAILLLVYAWRMRKRGVLG